MITRKSQWILPAVCIVGSMALYGILEISNSSSSESLPGNRILRDGYAGLEEQYELLVDGVAQKAVPVTVQVSPRAYTQEEAMEAFYHLMDDIENRIRGENRSLTEVESDLELISRDKETGISIRWQSSEPELLSSMGKIMKSTETPRQVILSARLTVDGYHADFQVPIRLVPRTLSPDEQLLAGLQQEIEKRNEEQKTDEYLVLPERVDGRTISYRREKKENYFALPFLGIFLAFLLVIREREAEKVREKRREKELLLDYAELVSKLMILVGAGMTIRSAWERMVKDYEHAREMGKQKQQAAGEEMCRTYYQLVNGMPEGTAYREFGRRCKLQPYLKLSSVLEQNRKAGTKNLRAILRTEMEDAFEMRKNLARRMGEEAGTKLLAPLFLMLGIVMVMIMAPAMMMMG